MKKRIILSLALFLSVFIGFSAYSNDSIISKDAVLYVQDHAGDNFLVVNIEMCSLGNNGEITCAMKPDPQAKPVNAGPTGSIWKRLAYPNG